MKLSFTLLLVFFIGNTYLAQAQKDDTKEPKTTLIVTVNGREYKVSEDEEINKDGNSISVSISKSKTFNNKSVSFDYPTSFGFEYESSYGYKNWTFDGNNFIIMYFELSGENTLNDFVDEISGRFGKSNCEIEKKSLKLGSRTLKGKRINVDLMGEKLTLDLLEIKMKDGKTRIIAFQDSLNDYGKATEEGKEAINLIYNTITYK